MQGRHLAVGIAAEDDSRGARPERREIAAEDVWVVGVGEPKAPAHGRDRYLPARGHRTEPDPPTADHVGKLLEELGMSYGPRGLSPLW